ncbi:hypothetical protein IMY05_010G0170700 [Salix suchowensis]|nr:hypothetical protein IMY05_010G0170700 [Salix suchowensis]
MGSELIRRMEMKSRVSACEDKLSSIIGFVRKIIFIFICLEDDVGLSKPASPSHTGGPYFDLLPSNHCSICLNGSVSPFCLKTDKAQDRELPFFMSYK